MEYKFIFLDKTHIVELTKDKDSYKAVIDKKEYYIKDYSVTSNAIMLNVKNQRRIVYIVADKEHIYIAVNGECYIFEFETGQRQKIKASVGVKGNSVASPMPGLLVKVPVKVGDQVQANSTLAVVEARSEERRVGKECRSRWS